MKKLTKEQRKKIALEESKKYFGENKDEEDEDDFDDDLDDEEDY